MRRLPVVFRAQALADLHSIEQYIAADDPAAASWVVRRIHDTIFRTLARFPHGGRLDPETGVREFAVARLPYLIIFIPKEDALDIVGIFHTSRPPSAKPTP
jgi:toxin ParE1/3/4